MLSQLFTIWERDVSTFTRQEQPETKADSELFGEKSLPLTEIQELLLQDSHQIFLQELSEPMSELCSIHREVR